MTEPGPQALDSLPESVEDWLARCNPRATVLGEDLLAADDQVAELAVTLAEVPEELPVLQGSWNLRLDDPRWQQGLLQLPSTKEERVPSERRLRVRCAFLKSLANKDPTGLAAALWFAVQQRSVTQRTWHLRDRKLEFQRGRPQLMGIVNVTPDSFSDGGLYLAADAAVRHGVQLVAEGAALLDIGGESTRPGSDPVPLPQELDRVLPVLERLQEEVDVPLSVDTTKAAVAAAALRVGCSVVNDTSALADDAEMAAVVAQFRPGVILMHRQGRPRRMQADPHYDCCEAEVTAALRAAARRTPLPRSSLALDPGIGFGKRLEHNLDLLRSLGRLRSLGCVTVVGASRKSFLGHLLGRKVEQRAAGTQATTAAAFLADVDLIRVHAVQESADVVKVLTAALHG
jgi:dihydropteroate synthase